MRTGAPAAAAAAIGLLAAGPSIAATCADLAALGLPDTTIDAAQAVPAGDYTPSASARFSGTAAVPLSASDGAAPPTSAAFRALPAFCRVHGTIAPVPGSRIGFELWLPLQGWNDRLLMLGNGGYSSTLSYSMGTELKAGFATLATDTGHTGDDPTFAIGHPEAIVDWAHRAVHESAVKAKALVAAFYERPARNAYFAGCSTGGHQAFMEAQRYPDDFDGILAGAPGHNRTHINAGFLWQYVSNHAAHDDATQIIPASKLPMITRAVLNACRANNGKSSGGLPSDDFLDDPETCDFDPASLQCSAQDGPDCLTAPQVGALKRMYEGAHDPRNGERIYVGWEKGSENSGRALAEFRGWSLYWANPGNPKQPARVSFWRYWAFDNPAWNWWSFDFDHDMTAADDKLAPVINAMSPDLARFRARGAKMIHYHGLADPVVPPMDSVSYHGRVVADIGQASSFYRLFLVPGMEHCRGGAGPDAFDALPALQRWVGDGVAPDRIVATHFAGEGDNRKPAFTRPLCPFPQQARFTGGDPNVAADFVCALLPPSHPPPALGADFLR